MAEHDLTQREVLRLTGTACLLARHPVLRLAGCNGCTGGVEQTGCWMPLR